MKTPIPEGNHRECILLSLERYWRQTQDIAMQCGIDTTQVIPVLVELEKYGKIDGVSFAGLTFWRVRQ